MEEDQKTGNVQVCVRIPKEQLDGIDQLALWRTIQTKRVTTRADVLRSMIEAALSELPEAEISTEDSYRKLFGTQGE